MSLRVAINTISVQASNEGTRTMLVKLLPALRAVDPELEQVLLCSDANRSLFDDGTTEVVQLPLGEAGALTRIWYDQRHVPRAAARARADVLVTPTGVGPLRLGGLPHVVIMSAHLPLPSCQAVAGKDGLHGLRRLYYGAPFRRMLHRADEILPISEFLAERVVSELGVDPAKVTAMPLGVEPAAAPPRITDREPLALFVGTLYGYKDHDVAVRAFAAALPRLPAGARLVVVGKDLDGTQLPMLRALVAELGVEASVALRERVDDDELERLYATASLLLMPSRCEGFGLPVAEAMGRGLPVAAADATSLPGVLGDAGILVPPGDVAGFADAIVAVLGDDDRRQDLARRGLARAATLTWDAAAERLAQGIRRAVRSTPQAGRAGTSTPG
jgi:glycosyltransferase involved in cell wall biosynthesis